MVPGAEAVAQCSSECLVSALGPGLLLRIPQKVVHDSWFLLSFVLQYGGG